MDKGDPEDSSIVLTPDKIIKVFYKAHGSNASWEWLEHIGPCVDVLRELARSFNDILGADQGTRHAPADLSDDIQTLMDSLDEHNVYRIQRGRVLKDDDGAPVKDSITTGLQSLTSGNKNPLSDYNDAFSLLQARRKIVPVSAQAEAMSHTPEGSEAAETQMDTSIDLDFSHGPMPEAGSEGDLFLDSVPEDHIIEEDRIGEVARIIEDLENGIIDPTLARVGAEDVALDMDDIYILEDDNWSDSSSEGSAEGAEEEE